MSDFFKIFLITPVFFILSFPASSRTDSLVTPEYFGVDAWYSNPDIWSDVYGAVSEDSLHFGLIGKQLRWSQVEPEPPIDEIHSYNWAPLDYVMTLTQQAGFTMDLGLETRSNWAVTVPDSLMNDGCCQMSPLLPDSLSNVDTWGMTAEEAWYQLVYAVVERYDGDGIGDADGIDRPLIRIIQLGDEPEAPGHFFEYGGTMANYDHMLGIMYDAAKSANPDIIVARGKTNPSNIFDDDPDVQTLQERRPAYLDSLRSHFAMGGDNYDVFAINYNDHYTGLLPFIDWLTGAMAENGFTRPFMVADARTSLYPRGNLNPDEAVLPPRYTETFMDILRQPDHPDYTETLRIFQADETRQCLRKYLVGLEAHLSALSLQPVLGPAVFEEGNLNHRNMWQDAGLFNRWMYDENGNLSGAKEPAYYASIQLMNRVVGAHMDFTDVIPDPETYACSVHRNGDQFFIAWHENPFDLDENGLVRRGQEISVDLSEFLDTPNVRMTHFVTELDENNLPVYPEETCSPVQDIPINETPVIISPVPPGDVNDDGLTNVLDVVQIISYILGLEAPTSCRLRFADINSDNNLDVLDIVLIIDLIL